MMFMKHIEAMSYTKRTAILSIQLASYIAATQSQFSSLKWYASNVAVEYWGGGTPTPAHYLLKQSLPTHTECGAENGEVITHWGWGR